MTKNTNVKSVELKWIKSIAIAVGIVLKHLCYKKNKMGTIKLKSRIKNDNYTNYVYDAFDIQNKEETEVEVKYNLSEAKNFDWNIGVIYGSSGSGKTTILKKIGELSKSIFD
jgi:putative ribosome biogenesis GTPase RsgA